MKFPTLKNALLCRILVYIVVLGGFIAPIVIVANLGFVPNTLKIIVGICFPIALIVYHIKNFVLLMAMDISLATLHCHNTARKRFLLSRSFSVQRVQRRISRYGKNQPQITTLPLPHSIRYKSNAPMTIYSSGIEKVLITYHIDFLDKNQYHSIINSANASSRSLIGKKKHLFLDKSQKKAPLNRVTVIFIFAKQIDSGFKNDLFKVVCQNGGDGYNNATIPCVVDLEERFATFDSVRIPYVGFQYPVKNRGIRLIKRYLFNNRLPLNNSPDTVDPIKDIDPKQSLWAFWRDMKKELILDDKEAKKRFEKMKHKDIIFEDNYIYLKWESRGIWRLVEINEETKEAEIDVIDSWYYPKPNKIAKDTINEIKKAINSYFAELGYTTRYNSYE